MIMILAQVVSAVAHLENNSHTQEMQRTMVYLKVMFISHRPKKVLVQKLNSQLRHQ